MRKIRKPTSSSTQQFQMHNSHNQNDNNSEQQIEADLTINLNNILNGIDYADSNAVNESQSNISNSSQLDHLQSHSNPVEEIDFTNALDSIVRYGSKIDDEHKSSHILTAIREVVSCCACFTCDVIMKECINGHLICQNCFLTIRQDDRPQCPTCRASLHSDSKRALIAQKVMSELPDICTECKTKMLHKSMTNHRLKICHKRLVSCGFTPLGCKWMGSADQYDCHYSICYTRKCLLEKPIEENLQYLLNHFQTHEQSIKETFQCFSTVLKHLESHELQTMTVHLSCVNASETDIVYRSDIFHINQSRWTIEIFMKFDSDSGTDQLTELNNQLYLDPQTNNEHLDTIIPNTQIPNSQTSPYPSSYTIQPTNHDTVIMRRRKRFSNHTISRHHPYNQHTFRFRSLNPELETLVNRVELQIPPNPVPHEQFGFRQQHQQDQDYHHRQQQQQQMPVTTLPNLAQSSNSNWKGNISYRIVKENNPGVGRKSFGFVLLHIKVPETEVHIIARPQLQTHRFNIRGEHTSTYKINLMRYKYISTLNEMSKYRLIQAEFIIARKLSEESVDN